jgi:hypothetical protein
MDLLWESPYILKRVPFVEMRKQYSGRQIPYIPRPIHFYTFGNIPLYAEILERITREARDSGYFHTVTAYTQDTLPGIVDHAEFIRTHPRGYGYWVWKPLVLAAGLRAIPEGDILVYLDAGSYICKTPAASSLFSNYISAVETHPTHRIGFLQQFRENEWCKADLLETLGVRENPRVSHSGQFWAGGHVMMNTPENRAFVEEWAAIAISQDYHLLDDSPSTIPNHFSFKEHRHDQAILSILLKLRGCVSLPAPPMTGDSYPMIPARIRPTPSKTNLNEEKE